MYVSDLVQTDYQKWNGQFVLLSTPTGSGKTTFILNTLLRHAIQQKKHIVYICNRKLLKRQIAHDSELILRDIFQVPPLDKEQAKKLRKLSAEERAQLLPNQTGQLSAEQKNWFIIQTYQYFETAKFGSTIPLPRVHPDFRESISADEVLYFIWDEAHYLGTEIFNRNFNYWFERFTDAPISFPKAHPSDPPATHIFLTATPAPFKLFLAAHFIQGRWVPHGTGNYHKVYQDLCRRNEFLNHAREKAEVDEKNKNWEKVEKETGIHVRDAFHPKDGFPLLSAEEYRREAAQVQLGADVLAKAKEHIADMCIPAAQALNAPACEADHAHLLEYPSRGPSVYQHMPSWYFSKLSDLIEPIQQNLPAKWLIFIDNELEGTELEGILNGLGISTVLLSSQQIKHPKSPAKREYQNIIENSKFSCTVLISTSIMDCGVNIKDPAVGHIAISHNDQTTTLQMLGRKRLAEGEMVTLYFRCAPPSTIRQQLRSFEDQMKFMVEYSVSDDTHVEEIANGFYVKKSVHTQNLKSRLASEMLQEKYNQSIYQKSGIHIQRFEQLQKEDYLKDYYIGSSSFFYLLSKIDEYRSVMAQHDAEHNPLFYFEYQLSWIDQTYDENRWLQKASLIKKLEAYQSEIIACVNEKCKIRQAPEGCISSEDFVQDCISTLDGFPLIPAPLRRYFSPKHPPQINALNKIFSGIGLPYRLKSAERRVNHVKISTWRIIQQNAD